MWQRWSHATSPCLVAFYSKTYVETVTNDGPCLDVKVLEQESAKDEHPMSEIPHFYVEIGIKKC